MIKPGKVDQHCDDRVVVVIVGSQLENQSREKNEKHKTFRGFQKVASKSKDLPFGFKVGRVRPETKISSARAREDPHVKKKNSKNLHLRLKVGRKSGAEKVGRRGGAAAENDAKIRRKKVVP